MKYGFSDCKTVVIDCSVVGKKRVSVQRKVLLFCCFILLEHFGSLEVKLSDDTFIITHIRGKVWQNIKRSRKHTIIELEIKKQHTHG